MSAFLDKADEIKTRLETVEALEGIDILVDRQKDIKGDFAKAIAKKKGAAIIIFFQGYETHEEKVQESHVTSDFVITIWSKPILQKDQVSAGDILSEVHQSLHAWQHSSSCRDLADVSRGRLVPNKSYLIYEVRTKIKHSL